MTERLGITKSPFTVEELLEALYDPRFFVRFEAIVSIARRRPDPRLTDALIEKLEGDEPALSTVAAWALGRIGDERALKALRGGLNARYRSVQAHCARSLGSLGDTTVTPIRLQLAFAAALGKLGALEAIDPLLALLRESGSQDARLESALALARLVGEEHDFIQLQRRVESEPGTTLSQQVTALKGKLAKSNQSSAEMEETLDAAAETLAQHDLAQGIDLLRHGLQLLLENLPARPCRAVIQECVARLEQFGTRRLEYAVLALHAAECASAD
jgi:HEAT repeat protein